MNEELEEDKESKYKCESCKNTFKLTEVKIVDT